MDKIFTANGPIDAENRLIKQIQAEVQLAIAKPNLLAKPVLIVVPSSELRLNLIVRLAASGATLGVEVQTLHSLALNLHRSAGNDTSSRSMLSEVLARRAALLQPGLAKTFQPLVDGFGVVASSIRDLLSSGYGVDRSAEIEGEAAIDIQGSATLTAQTNEVLQAAAQTQQSMLQRGCRRPGDLQAAAANLVPSHLHARSVWIYGFADVTAQSKQLIQALWKWGAKLMVDLPPDPAFAGEDRGALFARRFAQKVSGNEVGSFESQPADCRRKFFNSSGRSDEVREVAHRIRDLIFGGTIEPEKIGVVVRGFDAYAAEFRYWFEQLGVPFRSASAPAGFFPDHRRMQAAIEVLQRGRTASVDRWLDALSRSERGGGLASKLEDFRIAMRTLGVARLEQALALDAAKLTGKHGVYRLPVRTTVNDEATGDDPAPRSQTRAITIAQLTSDFGLLQQTLDRIQNWPSKTTLAEHAEYARLAFEKDFAWRPIASYPGNDWQGLLNGIAQLDTDNNDYTADEFMILLAKAASGFGAPKAGQASGGVAVLDFTQARSRTFEHLFLLGLNRGLVPRVISEDPVLPDQQRGLLQGLIPDLQQRFAAHDEERYLFAQLCAASKHLCLSWLRADDDGKELAPSPFLQRIWLAGKTGEAEKDVYEVPRLRSQLFENQKQPLSRAEAEQYFALRGQRSDWQGVMDSSTSDARHRILNEIEPDFSQPEQRKVRDTIGPYLGWIAQRDSPPEKVFVTRLEAIAACPWRSLLTSRLRLEPVADPVHDLPRTNAMMIGNVVHEALEQLVRDGASNTFEDSNGVEVVRPKPEGISEALKGAALKVALQEEMRLDGMIEALTAQAAPLLHKAIELEWPNSDSVLHVVGCEVTKKTRVKSEELEFELHFRADRVDREGEDLVYTDYKTAKPLSAGKNENTRMLHHINKVRSGNKLQGTAYACSESKSVGRYLFLNLPEDAGLDRAEFRVSIKDEGFEETFTRTSGVLYQSLLKGVAIPRMEMTGTQKENPVCGYCDVADACLLKDSGNRRRLVGAVENLVARRNPASEELDEKSSLSAAELNIIDLWYLKDDKLPWLRVEDEVDDDGEEESGINENAAKKKAKRQEKKS